MNEDSLLQKTIAGKIQINGRTLYSGEEVSICLLPAREDTGIIFLRKDKNVEIHASVEFVSTTKKEIVLSKDGVNIRVVEHILSAAAGLGIDNLIIELTKDELPIGDGSALFFVDYMKRTGIITQNKPKKIIYIKEPLWVQEGDKYIIALPSEDDVLKISYTIDFPNYKIKSQYLSVELTEEIFIKDIAPARTFGFLEEIEELLKNNLIQGGSLDNAVIITKDKILNNNLRFEDEPIRHKILDLVGDLSLLGNRLIANIIAVKSGHSLNIQLLKKIFMSRNNKDITKDELKELKKELKIEELNELNIEQIKGILPHRSPFLFVDKIIRLERGKRIVGLKNVTINEPYFAGHFPRRPIMPGVLIIEAMAQTGGVLVLSQTDKNIGDLIYFTGMDKVRFRRPVVPGDQLIIEVIPKRIKEKAGIMSAKAYVKDQLVAEAEFMFAVVK